MQRPIPTRRRRLVTTTVAAAAAALLGLTLVPGAAAQTDDRVGLGAGLFDAEEAISNLEKLDTWQKSEGGFFDPTTEGTPNIGATIANANSDLAFGDGIAVMGNYSGFQVFDISDPSDIRLRTEVRCPGGQGDPSLYGNLLFISVEETRARTDCGTQGTLGPNSLGTPDPERFRGVRIFDLSDLDNPVQVAAVQTCRGSHTHTLVTKKGVKDKLWVYNSGTSAVRLPAELAGCQDAALTDQPVTSGNPTQWRIDVIEVPLKKPSAAKIVSQPRLFVDKRTGAFNGLQNTLAGALHPSGTPYSPLPNTNTCHDVTAYPEIGLLAGACQGNGILVDISNPVKPKRLDAVADPNFSYWHSATFSNDGKKVVFTDEWGGGLGARCRDTDRPEWGANAIFDIRKGKLEFRSYYKLPAPQTTVENCVAHNGSIIPVPNRDIMVQSWYQGGISVLDFTDSRKPKEIAYFDRGPLNADALALGGFWSSYWYDGEIVGSEIARGVDTFGLLPSAAMSANEIESAREVRQRQFNAQLQTRLDNPLTFARVGARLDQNVRAGSLSANAGARVQGHLDRAEQFAAGRQKRAALAQLDAAVASLKNARGQDALVKEIKQLRSTIR